MTRIFFILVLFFFIQKTVGAADWMVGKYEIKIDTESSRTFVVERNRGKLIAIVRDDKSEDAVEKSVIEMSSKDVNEFFESTIGDTSGVECFVISQLLVCHSPRDLKIKQSSRAINKGFFGAVPDVGIVVVKKKN